MLISIIMMTAAMQASSPPPTRSSACAENDTVKLTPADTLQRLDDFRTSLPASDRLRLDRALPRSANGGIAQCDAVEGSRASCEAAAYMPALRSTGLMPRFLATICPKP
jgi:hypothetical protein